MTLDAADVTAIIVTRGDVDLTGILGSLPYGAIVVWDNSTKPWNARCYGRYLAAQEAATEVVYYQDDDIIFRNHDQLLAAYQPGKILANMPSPWYERSEYDRLDMIQVGAGSLARRDLHCPAIDRYLERWAADDILYTQCDDLVGKLIPHVRVDFGYEILPCAEAPGRICTSPLGGQTRPEMHRRIQELL